MKQNLTVKLSQARFEEFPLTWDDWIAMEEGKSKAILSVAARVLVDEQGKYIHPGVAEQILRRADFTKEFVAEIEAFSRQVQEFLVPPGSGGA